MKSARARILAVFMGMGALEALASAALVSSHLAPILARREREADLAFAGSLAAESLAAMRGGSAARSRWVESARGNGKLLYAEAFSAHGPAALSYGKRAPPGAAGHEDLFLPIASPDRPQNQLGSLHVQMDRSALHAAVRRAGALVAAIELAVLAGLAAVLAFLLQRRVFGPISQMRGVFGRLERGEPLGTVVLAPGAEIAGLARAFAALPVGEAELRPAGPILVPMGAIAGGGSALAFGLGLSACLAVSAAELSLLALLAALLHLWIGRPSRALARAFEQLRLKGQARAAWPRRDEFGELAVAFNDMARELAKRRN